MNLGRRVVRWIRGRLPTGAEQATRRAALRLGVLTAGGRMLPTFVIVGAQRSGTTSLFRLLSEHPQVVRPTLSKGMAFFDLNYAKGLRWYRGHFPLRRPAELLRRRRDLVTFESSGYYMMHPLAARRLAADLPNVKVVAMVRDPVDRAHSAHRHESRRGFEDEDFETAIELENDRTEGESARIVSEPGYESFELQHHAYLARGRYAEQLDRYAAELGRDRIYVVDADQFFNDPRAEFDRLCDWLGLDRHYLSDVSAWNAAPRSAMPDALRETLGDHFAIHDTRLEPFLGRRPSWRSESPIAEQP